jgi:hypothetical protein
MGMLTYSTFATSGSGKGRRCWMDTRSRGFARVHEQGRWDGACRAAGVLLISAADAAGGGGASGTV